MATDDTELNLTPPEPWQTLVELADWLDDTARRTRGSDPALAVVETRDALKTVMRDLLNVVKFYRTDREHPSARERELVPRFTVMVQHEDETATSHGVFATEQMAEAAVPDVVAEQHDVKHVWVRRMLVSVALERLNDAMARFLAETGLTEDELVDAITHHPA
jgi:hypothetical protein